MSKRRRWAAVLRAGIALAGAVLVYPVAGTGQGAGRAMTRATLIGMWRYHEPDVVTWDPRTQAITTTLRELVLTLRTNGTFNLTSTLDSGGSIESLASVLPGEGRWSLVGKTLTLVQHVPDNMERFTLSSPAPGKVTMAWQFFPLEWERVDPGKPLALLGQQPPTVTPAALAGTWVVATEQGADTLILRADGTWAGQEWDVGYPRCRGVEPADVVNTGRWYLGPNDVAVFIDSLGRRLCNHAKGWRGGWFKFDGRRLMSYNPWLYYDRVKTARP